MKPFLRIVLASSLALLLAACGQQTPPPAPPPAQPAQQPMQQPMGPQQNYYQQGYYPMAGGNAQWSGTGGSGYVQWNRGYVPQPYYYPYAGGYVQWGGAYGGGSAQWVR